MSIKAYYHTDSGAPVLSGTAGALTNLLKACLVDGYGSKTSLGWTALIASGVNKMAFKGAATGSGCHLYVDDTGPGAYGLREARCRGYSSIDSLDGSGNPVNGTNPFPTTAQLSTGIQFRKSTTLDATVRAWALVGDDRAFYFFVDDGLSAPEGHCFGDIVESGVSKFAALCGRYAETNTASYNSNTLPGLASSPTTTQVGKYLSNGVGGVGGSTALGFAGQYGVASFLGGGGYGFPNAEDSKGYVSSVGVQTASAALLGRMPGLYQPLHTNPLSHLGEAEVIGGPLSGRVLKAFTLRTGSGTSGQAWLDMTGPWR